MGYVLRDSAWYASSQKSLSFRVLVDKLLEVFNLRLTWSLHKWLLFLNFCHFLIFNKVKRFKWWAFVRCFDDLLIINHLFLKSSCTNPLCSTQKWPWSCSWLCMISWYKAAFVLNKIDAWWLLLHVWTLLNNVLRCRNILWGQFPAIYRTRWNWL